MLIWKPVLQMTDSEENQMLKLFISKTHQNASILGFVRFLKYALVYWAF